MDTINNPLLIVVNHDDKDWLERVQQGGCFILAETIINEWIPSIADELMSNRGEVGRLYWGEAGRIHGSISPYLLPVTLDNWPQIKQEVCHQDAWGVALVLGSHMRALTPAQQFTELLTHLRQWTLVNTHEGQQILRLSDWQVLSTLLQASNGQELSALLGPLDEIMYRDHEGESQGEEHSLNDDNNNRAALNEGAALSDNTSLNQRADPNPSLDPSQESDPDKSNEWQTLKLVTKQPVESDASFPRTLSQSQQLALAQMSKLEQYKDYREHLHQHHIATQEWNDKQMSSFIEKQLDIATQHDFNNPQDKVRFLSLSVVFGQDVVEQPWAKSVLTHNKQQGAVGKMDQLHEAAMAQL
ncbi:DUF4123 domain-containing protein [uncultured Shewanella sp.]|uniref:DUF4123 domain-containing protein n=1 Tax=uncultured Shewanella sp. TaxID=173975 RepID=UPI002603D761|nr:DUF4123 domain-containing protein [uncultured Shewanella sp.]